MKKTAIITGGSRGIGFGIAKELAADGCNIAILDLNAQADYQHNLDQLTVPEAVGQSYSGAGAGKIGMFAWQIPAVM